MDATPGAVNTIVFWSKNYGPFLESGIGPSLIRMGYNLYFHFSLISGPSILEPNVPRLSERLKQLFSLCEQFGGKSVAWRFDPICFYRIGKGGIKNNLSDFPDIAEAARTSGVKRCIASFMDQYRKIDRRISYLKAKGTEVPEPAETDERKKMEVVERMARLLTERGIRLELCCEKDLCCKIREKSLVRPSACISGPLFETLFGTNPDKRRDRGQRASQGCLCTRSVDIGSYDEHPCFHNCVFCYANPVIDTEIRSRRNGK